MTRAVADARGAVGAGVAWVLVCAALLLALLAGFANLDVAGPDATFRWQVHREAVSLTAAHQDLRRGLAPHDSFAKEFPIVYNSLNEFVLSAIARATGKPPYVVHGSLYPKLLLALFVLGNFVAIHLITRNKLAALLSTLLLSFTTDVAFLDRLHASFDPNVASFKSVMHLPSLALPLGTGQCLGWALFMPTLAGAYLASRSGRWPTHVAAGALLGLLFQAHTLTFINVMTIVSVWFLLNGPTARWRRAAFVLALAALALMPGGFGTVQIALLWIGAFLLSIGDRRDLVRLATIGASAILVSAQYLHGLLQSLGEGGFEVQNDYGIAAGLVASYYIVYWLLFAILFARPKEDPERLGVIMVLCTLVFGFGQLLGFHNHQYRFIINLCFGLFLLAPLALLGLDRQPGWRVTLGHGWRAGSRAGWWPRVVLLLVLCVTLPLAWAVSAYRDAMVLVGRGDAVAPLGFNPRFYGVEPATDEEDAFLRALGVIPRGERVLLPPEDAYPRRAFHNAVILGTGAFRGLIPDHRYILDQRSYRDRVFVYCNLFPGYRHWDFHTGARHCDELRSVEPDAVAAGELDVLGIYGIRFIPYWPEPSEPIRPPVPGSRLLFESGHGHRISRIDCEGHPERGRICFSAGDAAPEAIRFRAAAPRPGRYRLCFAGLGLPARTRSVSVDGKPVDAFRVGANGLGLLVDFPGARPREIHFTFEDGGRAPRVPIVPFYRARGTEAGPGDDPGCG